MPNSSDDKDSLITAIEAARAVALDPALTPGGRCAALLDEVAAMDVHPAHEARLVALIAEFRAAAPELVKSSPAALDQGLRDWWKRFFWGGFSNAPAQPTWDEHIAGWCKLGWTAKELDMDRMWSHVDGGRNTKERIVSSTENSLTLTSGKTFTREQLGLRPYAPAIQPKVVIGGAVAGGPGVVYSDRPVIGSHENPK